MRTESFNVTFKGKRRAHHSASEQRTITPKGAPVPTTQRESAAWRTALPLLYPAPSMWTLCSPLSPFLGPHLRNRSGELGQGNLHFPLTPTHTVHTCSSHHISSLTPDRRTLQVNFKVFGVYLDFFFPKNLDRQGKGKKYHLTEDCILESWFRLRFTTSFWSYLLNVLPALLSVFSDVCWFWFLIAPIYRMSYSFYYLVFQMCPLFYFTGKRV